MLILVLRHFQIKFNFTTERLLIFRDKLFDVFFFCRTALDLLPQKKLLSLDDSERKPEGALFLKSWGQGEHRQLQPQS